MSRRIDFARHASGDTDSRHGLLHGGTFGQLGNPSFNPLSYIPFGVRLTAYGGQATDLPPAAFDKQLKAIAEGRLKVPVAKVYHGLKQVRRAQSDLEAGTTPGKHVVMLD
ncbi:zinc-binding dehydrogenase [Bradyrhizobium sp. SEMIA]|uniref:zinc-binding dehydrogenase n=1 Tax=Bradyrhizobium sp. SEMIA TaxID=2597515 RepID=UPI003A102243